MRKCQFYYVKDRISLLTLFDLLSVILEKGFKILIVSKNEQETEKLNQSLWLLRKNKFLPHGSEIDAYQHKQPIFLSHYETRNLNPNNADTIVFIDDDNKNINIKDFKNIIFFIGVKDDDLLAKMAKKWQELKKEKGLQIKLHKKTSEAGWQSLNEPLNNDTDIL